MNNYLWSIVVLPIPFTDLSSKKQRPCLIISSNIINNYSDDVIVLAITSNPKYADKFSTKILNEDLSEWLLPKLSYVRVNKVFTIHKSLIIKKVWLLKNDVFKKILKEFNDLVG